MEARELRIGNYVLDRGGKILRIDWWENINKVCMDMNINGQKVHPLTEHAEYCQPIPLTEQWLLDFGFYKEGETVFHLDLNEDDRFCFPSANTDKYIYIECSEYDYNHMVDNYCVLSTMCKHVHQLQNLYFALTGEELEIKEQ